MSRQAVTKENIAASVVPPIQIKAPWQVKTVEPLDGYRLRIQFIDGLEGEVEMAEFVHASDARSFCGFGRPGNIRPGPCRAWRGHMAG
ncbi:Protein of unknown function [Nitrosospira sp. Nl5]|nr:Protein of unknown function [Nitrosospira sp. Nl5]